MGLAVRLGRRHGELAANLREHAADAVYAHQRSRHGCGAVLAWVTLYENLNSTLEGQTNAAVVLTTNIYEQRPDGWFMIHHHGSPVMMAEPEPHSTVQ